MEKALEPHDHIFGSRTLEIEVLPDISAAGFSIDGLTLFVLSERKSQGLQEPDNQIFGSNAAVSTTGKTISSITQHVHQDG